MSPLLAPVVGPPPPGPRDAPTSATPVVGAPLYGGYPPGAPPHAYPPYSYPPAAPPPAPTREADRRGRRTPALLTALGAALLVIGGAGAAVLLLDRGGPSPTAADTSGPSRHTVTVTAGQPAPPPAGDTPPAAGDIPPAAGGAPGPTALPSAAPPANPTTPTNPATPVTTYPVIVAGTGDLGVGDQGYVALRTRPAGGAPRVARWYESETHQVVCWLHGERATSTRLGASSTVWVRTAAGNYAAALYLVGVDRVPAC